MKNGSLLLVDDDRRVLESMAEWLRSQGYRIDVAASLLPGTYGAMLRLIAEAGLSGDIQRTGDTMGFFRDGSNGTVVSLKHSLHRTGVSICP